MQSRQRPPAGGDGTSPRAQPAEASPGKSTLTRELGDGAPLPGELRARFEQASGHDLGGVRVHDGDAADRAAGSVGARAFATGQDIAFARGQYDPHSTAGAGLLAHEVAHTIQQRGAALHGEPATTEPGDAAETAADTAGAKLAAGQPLPRLDLAPAAIATKPAKQKVKAGVPEMFKTVTARIEQTKMGPNPKPQVEAKLTGDNVHARAPGIAMFGTVALKDDVDPDPDPVNVGWVQTLSSSQRIGVYKKDGKVTNRVIKSLGRTKDQLPGAKQVTPWYAPPELLTATTRSAFPVADDETHLELPAKIGDARLAEIQGADHFDVSLKAGTGEALTSLKSFQWDVPWAVAAPVDPATPTIGGALTIGTAALDTGPLPAQDKTANDAITDPDNVIQTYETDVVAGEALKAKGFVAFVTELPKHKRLAPNSYWNMVGALWKSDIRVRARFEAVGSPGDIDVTLSSDTSVSLPTGQSNREFSALAHMVYDPAKLGPGHEIRLQVGNEVQARLVFPYTAKTEMLLAAKTLMDACFYNVTLSVS